MATSALFSDCFLFDSKNKPAEEYASIVDCMKEEELEFGKIKEKYPADINMDKYYTWEDDIKKDMTNKFDNIFKFLVNANNPELFKYIKSRLIFLLDYLDNLYENSAA